MLIIFSFFIYSLLINSLFYIVYRRKEYKKVQFAEAYRGRTVSVNVLREDMIYLFDRSDIICTQSMGLSSIAIPPISAANNISTG